MTIEAHLSSVRAAEHDKQGAMVPGLSATQAKAIDIAYHRARLASALTTSVSPSVSLQALRALGAELTEPPLVAMLKASAAEPAPATTDRVAGDREAGGHRVSPRRPHGQ
jgi:hypothetical protein